MNSIRGGARHVDGGGPRPRRCRGRRGQLPPRGHDGPRRGRGRRGGARRLARFSRRRGRGFRRADAEHGGGRGRGHRAGAGSGGALRDGRRGRGASARSPRPARDDARGGVPQRPGRRPRGAPRAHPDDAPGRVALPPRRVVSVRHDRGAPRGPARGARAPQARAVVVPQADLARRRSVPPAPRGGPAPVLGAQGRAPPAPREPVPPGVRRGDRDDDAKPRRGSRAGAAQRGGELERLPARRRAPGPPGRA